ncbi:hypothetical protein, partial [Streptococcus pneumoniae]|uniref:hypothetical protein n=1 Tax=Streptococcus pneumoniae TaxID=1313 RepID=UPI004054CDAC
FYRSEHQKRKDEICPFSSLADFNPLQLTKSLKMIIDIIVNKNPDRFCMIEKVKKTMAENR